MQTSDRKNMIGRETAQMKAPRKEEEQPVLEIARSPM